MLLFLLSVASASECADYGIECHGDLQQGQCFQDYEPSEANWGQRDGAGQVITCHWVDGAASMGLCMNHGSVCPKQCAEEGDPEGLSCDGHMDIGRAKKMVYEGMEIPGGPAECVDIGNECQSLLHAGDCFKNYKPVDPANLGQTDAAGQVMSCPADTDLPEGECFMLGIVCPKHCAEGDGQAGTDLGCEMYMDFGRSKGMVYPGDDFVPTTTTSSSTTKSHDGPAECADYGIECHGDLHPGQCFQDYEPSEANWGQRDGAGQVITCHGVDGPASMGLCMNHGSVCPKQCAEGDPAGLSCDGHMGVGRAKNMVYEGMEIPGDQ